MSKTSITTFIFIILFFARLTPISGANINFSLPVANLDATFFVNSSAQTSEDSILHSPSALELKAEALLHKVTTNNRFIGLLAANEAYELPVGIKRTIAGIEYIIVLDELNIDPLGGFIKAYMTLQVPGSEKKLGFFADSVRVGPNGLEAAKLRLIKNSDVDIGALTLSFRSDITHIEWDCNGYVSTTIGGDVLFQSSIIKPLSNASESKNAMGSFFANFSDFNDVILAFSMVPFEISGLPKFEFYPETVFVDLSDIRNPNGNFFPEGFFPAHQPQELYTLWRGVFIPSFTVKLPPGLATKSSQPIEIGAQNMLIDENGITGQLFASNLLTLDQGRIGGWEFSIDTLGFQVFKNSFSGFKLTGEIKIPISEEKKGFSYAATLDSHGDLSFAVAYDQGFRANLWGAQLLLDPNSAIVISREGDTYKPKAILHGQMSIALGDEVSLGTFQFQDLVVSTEAPFIAIGACSLPNGLLAGFPVSITSIDFVRKENLIGLSMLAKVNFMASTESGFGGTGAFTIWAERNNASGSAKYSYRNTEVSAFSVDVNQGGFKLYGKIELYQQHATFGKGFRGMINATFLPNINVTATAQFGNVSGFRYWYVDALYASNKGVSVFAGLGLYGFGGGLSYRMKVADPIAYTLPTGNHTSTDNSDKAGVAFSGAQYVPNIEYGLGLKASVILGTHPSPKAVNGQVSFRIQFNAGGGVESVRFQGEACMASDIGSDPRSVPVRLTMDMLYNFTYNDLYGVNEAFVNLGILKGMHPNNRAGSVIFRFNKHEWFVHIGTPSSRIGLKLFNTFTFASYFMVGTNIPPFPPPPENVSKKVSESSAQSFEEGLIAHGSGFAFGSSFKMDTGEEKFLIFYGSFKLDAGFDIMLKNYGTEAYCTGFSPPLGVNGWYAMGQAYAFMSGRIGMRFVLFKKKRSMNILSISAATLLQAKLPNPAYFKGMAGGDFDILGGLVKGKCRFEFSVGSNCVVMGADPLGDITVISDISPNAGNVDVSVFVTPQVAFNIPINDSFNLIDENGENQHYRVQLSYFQVLADNKEIEGNVKWNSSKDVATFETTEIYPSHTDVTVKVGVIFQHFKGGKWENLLNDGKPQVEEYGISFKTGERPSQIPVESVVYTYPIAGMMNFHWKEHSTGYIKLTHDFGYLLNEEPDWQGVIIFDADNQSFQSHYNYNKADLKLTYQIPQNLLNQTVFNVRVAKVPTTNLAGIDENVSRTAVLQTDDFEQTQAGIVGERVVLLERNLYQLKVRTSKYPTFAQKLNDMQLTESSMQVVTTGIHNLIKFADLKERLDDIELYGEENKRLIYIDLCLDNNQWFNSLIKPLVYDGYPKHPSLTITWRDVEKMGVPPYKAIYIYQTANTSEVESLSPGTNFIYPPAHIGIKFSGVVIMNQDFQNLKNRAASLYTPASPIAETLLHYINGFFTPILIHQKYKSTLRYVIPGENIVTTEREIIFEI